MSMVDAALTKTDNFIPQPEDLFDFNNSGTTANEHLFKHEKAVKVDEDINDILSPTNPASKFLKELNLTVEDARQLEILDLLANLPRKERTKYGKRKEMTKEEKSELTKVRNREHARSTRKRKKIIMDALQHQVEELQRRLEPLLESKVMDTNNDAIYASRVQNLISFFSYRNSNSNRTYDDWMSIVSDNVRVTTPFLPPLNKDNKARVNPKVHENVCVGIDAVIRDVIRFPATISEILDSDEGNSFPCNPELVYTVDVGEIVAVADTLMCNWSLRVTLHHQSSPTKMPTVAVNGMAKCRFGFCDLRLLAVDIRFDMLGFLRLLEGVTGVQLVAKMLQGVKVLPSADKIHLQQSSDASLDAFHHLDGPIGIPEPTSEGLMV
mmetsp:Transcript_38096/g.68900  ORF Transcript_38096/g.68900 Transcript_38096/m.68900 type:complete len:381 (-) Transcript_38096:233-1375(-)